jgi:threonine/homoserine/homoserine lactone efflux protein
MDPLTIYVLVATFTPGPNNILSTTTASNVGFKKTFPFMLGVLSGTFIVFFACSMFNVFLFQQLTFISRFVGIVGAIYLAYLAYTVFTAKTEDYAGAGLKPKRLYWKGLTLTFINPKAVIYGLTVTAFYSRPQYLDSLFTAIMVPLILAVLCFVSVIIWGLFGSVFQKFLTKYQRSFNLAMGSLLLYSAILVLIDAY